MFLREKSLLLPIVCVGLSQRCRLCWHRAPAGVAPNATLPAFKDNQIIIGYYAGLSTVAPDAVRDVSYGVVTRAELSR